VQGGWRLLGIVLGVALAALIGCFVLRWVDAASMPVAVIQALFPVVVAATILVATTALVCRYRRLALVGAVPAVTGLVLAGASLVPHTAQPGPGQVTVLWTNIQFGRRVGAGAALQRQLAEHRGERFGHPQSVAGRTPRRRSGRDGLRAGPRPAGRPG